MEFKKIQAGDKVTRLLCGTIPMVVKVTKVTEDKIICGPWEFDRNTGHEIDEDIDCVASHLKPPQESE